MNNNDKNPKTKFNGDVSGSVEVRNGMDKKQASSSKDENIQQLSKPNNNIPSGGGNLPSPGSKSGGGRSSSNAGSSNTGSTGGGGGSSSRQPNNINRKQQQKNPLGVDPRNNPKMNQNKMKNFGKKNNDKKLPNKNKGSVVPGEGLFNGKIHAPNLPKFGLGSGGGLPKKKPSSMLAKKTVKKQAGVSLMSVFQAMPIQVKVAIIGGGFAFIVVIVIVIIIVATNISGSDGNRELKDDYLKGNYTTDELCEYLEQNDYLDDSVEGIEEKIPCEETKAYNYFFNFKELQDGYKETYAQYRFRINTELTYETLAYYYSDEELYQTATRDEMQGLMDAQLEEIEESCVVKNYNKKTQVCDKKKYVYTLYEFSLNKYISYLKYGTTSTHPNYQDKPVKRRCGQGKNVDYVFGFGLVNTSMSPIKEGSNCPGDPVTDKDYKDLPETRTSLEEMKKLGGVDYYETTVPDDFTYDKTDNGVVDSNTDKNVVINPSHQVSNPYTGVNTNEKNSMYNLGNELKSILESRGYNVMITDASGNDGYKSGQTTAGKDWFAGSTGVYIALHSNAGGGLGPEAYASSLNNKSVNFASALCNHLQQLYISNGRDASRTCNRNGDHLSEPKNSAAMGGVASALVEVGYHDNADEANWIVNNYSSIASAIADAIDDVTN